MCMKTVKSKFHLMAVSALALGALGLGSCSKSSDNSTTPPPPELIGGYVSSDSVAAGNLVAYWPFDGNVNDTKGGQTGTATGVTYASAGVRGQAYQGAAGAYATVTPSAAFNSLGSYSLSVWYKLAAQPADGDPAGLFFLTGTNTLNELIYEIEHYAPVSLDSTKIHHGFTNLGSPAWQNFTMEAYDTNAIGKWVNLITTYDGPSSVYIIYQDGVAIGNSSAFGSSINPTTLYTDDTKATLQGNLSWASDPPQSIILGTWPATLYGVSPTLGSNGCFEGQMDELRIFNKALTQKEAAGLYLNGLAGR
jgi:hypothetical protein